MQVFVILLFLGLFGHDQLPDLGGWIRLSGWQLATVLVVPKLLLAALMWAACRATLRSLHQSSAAQRLRRLDLLAAFYRLCVLAMFFHDLSLGLLDRVQAVLDHPPLLPELLVLAPPLLMIVWAWWCYYPLDRRLREAQLLRRIDEGLPIHPIWTRGQFIAAQLRFHVALLFLPLCLLLLLHQMTDRYLAASWWAAAVNLTGAGCIFLVAPVMIRHVWDTTALPPGELRDHLSAMCRRHRVGVRELLLWRTFGGMVNAAVMGLVRPLRYILLSDALLEMVPARQVEAVMAHELGHVRHHHMLWLLAAAAALSMGFMLLWTIGFWAADSLAVRLAPELVATLPAWVRSDSAAMTFAATAAAIGCWLLAFGWVSRRFERQADTFAVQHLSDVDAADPAAQAVPVSVDAVNTMVNALDHVARLNHIAPERKSWRHGAITWRQDHLRQLVGQPIDRLEIDRQILLIQAITVLLLGMGLSIVWLWP